MGANTFTYSYYSNGIGARCPQFAPYNWTNEVYGTQLTVECKGIFPTCNDVECVENAKCRMMDDVSFKNFVFFAFFLNLVLNFRAMVESHLNASVMMDMKNMRMVFACSLQMRLP